MAYSPPLTITPCLITLVSEISELIGHLALTRDGELAALFPLRVVDYFHPTR